MSRIAKMPVTGVSTIRCGPNAPLDRRCRLAEARLAPPRYIPLHEVGRGGMALVHAARDTRLGRLVALKRPRDPDHHHQKISLRREGRLLASLSHPNVVALHDAADLWDEPFLALELVYGPNLATWLASADHHWRGILAQFLAAGQGLAAVHAASIVHRDLKPSNILVGPAGRTRIADFGLAIAMGESGDPFSRTSGTPGYMAPEQHAGEGACAKSDQYAFALSLHEALWGDRPPGAQVQSRPIRRGRVLGQPPDCLRAVIQRAAAPQRGRRYPGMPDLLAALQWAAGQGDQSPSPSRS